MSRRHAACMLPVSKNPSNSSKKMPVSVTIPSALGILVQVRKVSTAVTELQKTVAVEAAARSELEKNMAVECAARTELQLCVEQLKVEAAESKRFLAQNVGNVERKDGANGIHHLMKTLPCQSIKEMDSLLAYIMNRNSELTEYIKLLGGSDFNSAIKITINAIMTRSVQSQVSWTGLNTKKPSFKSKYKGIIDLIHVSMKDLFKDYTIAQGEVKMHAILKNAAKM